MRKISFITTCFVAANLALGVVVFLRSQKSTGDGKLMTPVVAIESLGDGTLFFNDEARPFLLEQKPNSLTEEEKDSRSQRARAFGAALNDPKLWRQLDRRYRFDAVLLSGEPALYRPLLQHLLASADWPLTYLDHTSYIFRRAPAEAWSIERLKPIRERFEKESKEKRAEFLSQLGAKLSAVKQHTAAKTCLDEALKIDKRSPAAWAQLAAYHAHFSQWPEALAKADQALAFDAKFLPALAVKAQVLVAMKRKDEAYKVADQIYGAAGNDPAMLFLVAKVAHAAHAYWREVEALNRLIKLAEESSHPTSGYRIYLAQAYASQGEANPALEQFEKALADPDLSEEQRKFVEETVETIKSHVSM